MKTEKCSTSKQSFQPSEVSNKSTIASGASLLRSLLIGECSQQPTPIDEEDSVVTVEALSEEMQESEEHDEDMKPNKSDLIYTDDLTVKNELSQSSEETYACEVLEEDLLSDDSRYHNGNDTDEIPAAPADSMCPACLSTDRQMAPLGRDAEQAYIVLFNEYYEQTELKKIASKVLVCWECRARLADVIKLRKTIICAQGFLNNSLRAAYAERSMMSLSNLTTATRQGFDYKLIYRSVPVPTGDPSATSKGKKRGRPRKGRIPPPQSPPPPESPPEVIFDSADVESLDRCDKFDKWGTARKQKNDARFVQVPIEYKEMMDIREKLRQRPEYQSAPYKCHNCIETFNYITQLERHNTTKHSEEAGSHECEVCHVRFPDADAVARHSKRRHYILHACSVCGTTYAARAELVRHYTEVHGAAREYACNICGMTFKKERKMRYHKEKEHKPSLQCNICGKVYRNRQIFKYHAQTHTGVPTVECKMCGKSCRGDYGLYSHMRAAHDPRPAQDLQCHECGVQFKNLIGLRYHLRTSVKHATPARFRFQCEKCSKRFLSIGALNHHDAYYHKQYMCDICGKELNSRYTMHKHIKFVHERHTLPKSHICEVCGKAFKTKMQLKVHAFTHTGERPYSCEICAATFAQLSTLRTHQKLIHNRTAESKRAKEIKNVSNVTEDDGNTE